VVDCSGCETTIMIDGINPRISTRLSVSNCDFREDGEGQYLTITYLPKVEKFVKMPAGIGRVVSLRAGDVSGSRIPISHQNARYTWTPEHRHNQHRKSFS
jgi:hypothetical protein